jgi:hypothetical protein
MASGPAGSRGSVRARCACTPTPPPTIRLHRAVWFQKRLAGRGTPGAPAARRSASDASTIDSVAGSQPRASGPASWRRLARNQAAASAASAALAPTIGSTRAPLPGAVAHRLLRHAVRIGGCGGFLRVVGLAERVAPRPEREASRRGQPVPRVRHPRDR